jgi:hypothetical protein
LYEKFVCSYNEFFLMYIKRCLLLILFDGGKSNSACNSIENSLDNISYRKQSTVSVSPSTISNNWLRFVWCFFSSYLRLKLIWNTVMLYICSSRSISIFPKHGDFHHLFYLMCINFSNFVYSIICINIEFSYV